MSAKDFQEGLRSELFLFSAPDRDALRAKLGAWADLAARPPAGARLMDLAFTVSRDYAREQSTLALLATSFEDLAKKLAHARDRLEKPATKRIQDKGGIFYTEERMALDGRVAFVFPGEGAQYPRMLRGLCMRYPAAREAFDEFDEACADTEDGYRPSEVIFPPPGGSEADDEDAIFAMKGAVHAVTSANTALYRLFAKLGLEPDAVIGHSSGEFMALEVAGVMRFATRADRIRFIRDGYDVMNALAAMNDIPEGVLLTVGGIERAEVDEVLARHPGRLLMAMDNCPHQFVLCGPRALIDEVLAQFGDQGAICTVLPFSRPYHTAWFEPALAELRRFLRAHGLHAPRRAIYSCLSADRFPDDPAVIEQLAVQQWAATVRFKEAIEKMYADGIRVFVDSGPRGNMTAFIDDILRDVPHLTITANRAHRSDIGQFNMAVGQLVAHGAKLDPSYLFASRGARVIETAAGAAKRPPQPLVTDLPVLAKAPSLPAMIRPAAAGAAPLPELVIPGPHDPGSMDAVMASYLTTMETFLTAQREIIHSFFGGTGEPGMETTSADAPPPAIPPFLMLGELLEYAPGQRLASRRTLRLDEDLYLLDHTLGVQISKLDPDLPGLSVQPLTMSLQTSAEAANALFPDLRVIALKDIQANRWVSLENGHIAIRITATRIEHATPGECAVRVEIREADDADPRAAYRPPMVQATALLAAAYPAPVQAPPSVLKRFRPCTWRGKDIYNDRLFHLGRFQGVQSVDKWAEEGAEATIVVQPRDRWFKSTREPHLAIDGILLDNVGSVVGLWGNYEMWDGSVYLPFRVKRIDFMAPPPPPGTQLHLQCVVHSLQNGIVACDNFASDADGHIVIRIERWEDRIWDITPGLHRFLLAGFSQFMSDAMATDWAKPAFGERPFSIRLTHGVSHELLEGSHRVWQKALAYLILDREERKHYHAMRGNERRRNHWLFGRVAAEDAVRILLNEQHALDVGTADIAILPDDRGRPLVGGLWRGTRPALPMHVSIAHTDGLAVGIACEGKDIQGIGIDVERLREPSAEFIEGAFSDRDRALAAGNPERAWRWWCAKEAVGKALGVGLFHGARELAVAGEDAATGRVDLRLEGAWLEAFPAYKEKIISAYTSAQENGIFAVCVL
ncbi:MAG TPA: acyltransferase domain-containing protein [Kiritimatiellia bacterium]|nr:acyltransferase domain-containing protein [Kiritimatiellia bacterium]